MVKSLPNNPPKYLTGTAKYIWKRIVPLLEDDGHASDLDRTLVETFCINYQQLRDAYKSIQEEGQTMPIYKSNVSPVTGKVVATDLVGYKRNPSTQIIDTASKNLRSIANELGLSPQSRTDLLDLPKEDDSGETAADAIAEFFKKGDK
ncbi:phage terminase small subunit P27 family [Pediococcus stilesii]|uniref:Phage terminase small subunit P27 family n=1 Tax=Pediococcus stilesii TaxID=331679 RepID=A0A5R9BSS5_9LACO|nr:phage terminase small subunit P27 family [Pediococcus stilesii]TLQ03639.1 phage terminase small subunit P27 family [Pediococcus stilesii]